MPLVPLSIPRPGLALGRYPERRVERSSGLDEWFDRTAASVLSRWTSRTPRIENILQRIDDNGKSLVDISEDALSKNVQELRASLLIAGWNVDLAIRSFALIREMSGRRLGLRHFHSQLHGGWVMLQGKLAEMQTGEGKTLTAALPAATAALSGVPVHVITANDYLAVRDAELMRPLYEALELTVSVVTEGMDFQARQAAYACDITYCTNKQIAFDYLRDRVQRGPTRSHSSIDLDYLYDQASSNSGLMLRGLCFAIVDEADSVLIDEARTPLVLSRTVESDDSMVEIYQQALHLAAGLELNHEYTLEKKERKVLLTTHGSSRLAELSSQLSAPWNSTRQREELVSQALSALNYFVRDLDYVVRDDQIQLIDNNTGRIMSDRSWEFGLHQMIEIKEGCKLSGQKETLARISYQRFFGRYLKLSGMTGTAQEVRQELATVYDLSVVTIAPHQHSRRLSTTEQVFSRTSRANAAMVNSARKQAMSGRPVLIGTRSVQKSELIAQQLRAAGSDVQVLNARQDDDEAQLIERAGKAGQITVATNMAGRGTDIALGAGVADKGGLHVIIVEHNDAARIDRQLYGRSARQGDPGSFQFFSSIEDELVTTFYPHWFLNIFSILGLDSSSPLPGPWWRWMMRLSQRSTEHRHRQARRQVERDDDHLRNVLSFTGEAE